jgi:2-polyprenyl-3-methyl-5-hydroxy-6-metoxy-1,4-benzoquinol methylase
MNISYEWIPGGLVQDSNELLKECSDLYSNHYGKWSDNAPEIAGKKIKLSSNRILNWLKSNDSAIYLARDNNELVAYAIALRLKVPRYGIISWVTQLVVHEKYRHQDIAKSILYSVWGLTSDIAWGIISANPYAIRALEKATRRRSDPEKVKQNIKKIMSIGIANVSYISEEMQYFVTKEVSKINTEFYVDHSNIDLMLENVTSIGVPWKLGKLEEGWEWLAFTFHNQIPIELDESELKKLLEASDKVVHNAYKRMDLTNNHQWSQNTDYEVNFILRECELKTNNTVIDFGCGIGRHAIGLAQKDIKVHGIDYIDKNIKAANKKKEENALQNAVFYADDCRTIRLENVKADAVICLYDVIGTYADNNENYKILKNIYAHLKIGGIALISVMNFELTDFNAKHKFSLKSNPSKLLDIKPSNIMETTGNIFNPDFYWIEEDTKIVYRKEQFTRGTSLPVELFVRDKRFTKNEIIGMCEAIGFEIIYTRYVNARDWETGFSPTQGSAKEILVKCKKIN